MIAMPCNRWSSALVSHAALRDAGFEELMRLSAVLGGLTVWPPDWYPFKEVTWIHLFK